MRPNYIWRLLPAAALTLMSGPGMALTLGRAQGAVLIGRPLDVSVPVVLDTDADASDLCPQAEVFYGDNRVEARPVELRSWTGSAGSLRVRVPKPVDEAFVTVQVRVGCRQSLSRRFVLLTEEPNDRIQAAAQAAPVAPTVLPAPTALPVSPEPRAEAPAPAPAATPAPRRAAPPVRSVAPTRPHRPAKRRVAPAHPPVPAPAPAPAVERPRLKLEAAEIRTTPPDLKASQALQAPPTPPTAPQRAEAAAQWQALNSQPEDVLRNAQHMLALEADIRAMRESMVQNQALLREMRARLDQAEHERYANGLVYALAALLAAAAALAGWFWQRSRRVTSAWWTERVQPSEPVLHEHSSLSAGGQSIAPVAGVEVVEGTESMMDEEAMASVAAAATRPAPLPAAVAEVPQPTRVAEADAPTHPAPLSAVQTAPQPSLPEVPAVAAIAPAAPSAPMVPPAAVTAPATAPQGPAMPALAGAGAGDAVSVDELSDLQQQAEFFVSLGEADRAIGVLRAHLDAHPKASAMAWLELADIYHRLGRREDYEQLRRDFEWSFQAQLPAFDAYAPDRAGLEMHPALLAQIQSSWGTPAVRGLIDEAVRRRPGDPADASDLETCRELLLLHGVAGELEAPAEALSDESAIISLPLDLDSLLSPHPDDGWRKLAGPNSRPAGLDIDLDALAAPKTEPAALASAGGIRDGHLLDFDLDLSEEFKLPKR